MKKTTKPAEDVKTAAEAMLGKTALFQFSKNTHHEKLTVEVRIIAWRRSYGRVEFLVRPIAGNGFTWARQENIKLEGQP